MSYDNRGDNRGYRPRQEGKINSLTVFLFIYCIVANRIIGGGNRYRGGSGGGPQRFRGKKKRKKKEKKAVTKKKIRSAI
jgi:hypothetical protein